MQVYYKNNNLKHIMTGETIEKLKKQYIIKGIADNTETDTKEKFNTYFLHSTDRKGYTLQITCRYLDLIETATIGIQPFWDDTKIDEIIKYSEEELKLKSAERFYQKYFE